MKLYKIGELATKANVSTRTIDYYTKLGLLQPEKRSNGNYRLYSKECLVTLQWIENWKREKCSLGEIKEKLEITKSVQQGEVLSKILAIQENMNKVEQDLKALAPMLQQVKDDKELNAALKQLTTKGVSVSQVVLAIVNESMYLL